MKKLVCLFVFLCFAVAAQAPVASRRLGNVVWDPNNCVVSWMVDEGAGTTYENFQVDRTVAYSIDFHKNTMIGGSITVKIPEAEAAQMHDYFHDLVTQYVQESTSWFVKEQKKQLKAHR